MGDCVLRSKVPTGSAPNGATSLGALGRIKSVRTETSIWCDFVLWGIPLPLILILARPSPTHRSPRANDKERNQNNVKMRNISRPREESEKCLLTARGEEAPDGALLLASCMNRKRTAAWPEIAPSEAGATILIARQNAGAQRTTIALATYTALFRVILARTAQALSATCIIVLPAARAKRTCVAV